MKKLLKNLEKPSIKCYDKEYGFYNNLRDYER